MALTLPDKIKNDLLLEAMKYARFSWHTGWEKSSGYIKFELSDDVRYGSCKVYIPWEKKKSPTDDQFKSEVVSALEKLQKNEMHNAIQKEFTRYVQNKYFVDVRRLKHQVELSLCDNLAHLIKAIESYENFDLPNIQELHNDLKNLECGISDLESLEQFLDHGKKGVFG